MYAIETTKLTKRYGDYEALRAVDLQVPTGSVFGFLGPNGAGKTTTIRILLGLLRATAGRARVLGLDVWTDGPPLRQQVGYLPGDVRFYDHLTGRAVLQFADAVRGSKAAAEVERLSSLFVLQLDKRVRDYSRGMKQKLGLILAMMHRPRLLILDEPTTGLDPLMQQTLYAELRVFAEEGRTILFSSHTLSEVDDLCDHVAILRQGALIEQDRIEVLRRRAVRRVEVTLADGRPCAAPPSALHVQEQSGTRIIGSWTGEVTALLKWLAESPIADVVIAEPRLEDLFLAFYNESGGVADAGAN